MNAEFDPLLRGPGMPIWACCASGLPSNGRSALIGTDITFTRATTAAV